MAGRSSPAVPTYPALRPTPCTARSTLSVHVPRYAFRKFSAIADAFSGLIRWLGESSASAWSKRFTSQTVLSGTAFELPDARMLTPWGVNTPGRSAGVITVPIGSGAPGAAVMRG